MQLAEPEALELLDQRIDIAGVVAIRRCF